MSLKTDTKTKIKALGLDVEKLIAAVTATEEVDYEVPDGEFFKKEDLEARDANKVTEGKKLGEVEGEKKGKDLAAKALKKKFSIDDETKDLDKVVDMVTAKVSTGDAGLKQQVDLLLKDKESLQAQVAQAEGKAKVATFDAQLISMFPSARTADLKDNERLALAKMDLSFEELDGKTIVKRNGEVMRDKATQNPIPVNQALTDYFNERKWVAGQNDGGRGGGDNTGGGGGAGLKKRSQVQEQWVKENPNGNPVSPEFQNHLQAVAKDIADFDWYN